MEKYFETPRQVVFVEPNKEELQFCMGIAYKDEVICACCGGVFEISEILEAGVEYDLIQSIWIYEEWMDCSSNIQGGEYPENFPKYFIPF